MLDELEILVDQRIARIVDASIVYTVGREALTGRTAKKKIATISIWKVLFGQCGRRQGLDIAIVNDDVLGTAFLGDIIHVGGGSAFIELDCENNLAPGLDRRQRESARPREEVNNLQFRAGQEIPRTSFSAGLGAPTR